MSCPQEVCGRITDLREVPTAICCFEHKALQAGEGSSDAGLSAVHHRHQQLDHILAVGCSEGSLLIYRISHEFGSYSDAGAKKKNQVLLASALKKRVYGSVIHNNWISKLMFVQDIDGLISASLDGNIHIFDVMRCLVVRSFTGHQRVGVRAMDWCHKAKYVISVAERSILFWDPHTMDTISSLDSLDSPAVDVSVCDQNDLIVIATTNKSIHVWHSVTYEPLQVLQDKAEYRPNDALSSMLYVSELREYFTAGNRLAAWELDRYVPPLTVCMLLAHNMCAGCDL